LSKQISNLSRAELTAVLAELERRETKSNQLKGLEASLLPGIQLDVYNETSRQVAVLQPRGTGKTWGLLTRAIKVALGGGEAAYIAKTKRNVRDICWLTLKRMCKEHGIDARFQETSLICYIGSGRICFYGADSEQFRDNLRGTRWNLVVVDEAAHFHSDIDTLVQQILIPTTHARKGVIILCGTPHYIPDGLFYNVTSGLKSGGWSVHVCNDPLYSPYSREDVAETIQSLQEQYGEDYKQLPLYLREYEARWVVDSGSTVYRFDPTKNVYKDFTPRPGDMHVLGLDFSFSGNTGLARLVYNQDRYKSMFVLWSRTLEGVGLDQVDVVGPHLVRFHDETDGNGDIVYDYSQSFIADKLSEYFPQLNLVQARKAEKWQAIELFNADLRASRILVQREANKDLIHEWQHGDRKKNPDGTTPIGKPQQNPRRKWDVSDACLYAWRFARHREFAGAAPKGPKPGSAEYEKQLVQRMKEEAVARLRAGEYDL